MTAAANVWVYVLDTGGEPELPPALAANLPSAEAARAAALRRPQDRLNRRAAYAALVTLAARRSGIPPAAIGIRRDADGKLRLQLPAAAGPLHVSLSHSGTRIAIALAGCAVGVDLERIDQADHRALLREHFPHDPQPAGEDPQAWFFRLWTAKEALLKAIGSGLRLPLRDLVLRAPTTAFQSPTAWPAGTGLGQARVASLELGADYAGAVAVHGVNAAEQPSCTLVALNLGQFRAGEAAFAGPG